MKARAEVMPPRLVGPVSALAKVVASIRNEGGIALAIEAMVNLLVWLLVELRGPQGAALMLRQAADCALLHGTDQEGAAH